MFTHQSGAIWADMANIVWASGLHVTAAWYVVTETDSALREGSYVKGTVLLVLRKRQGCAQDHARRPGLGDPGGGREAGGRSHRAQPAGQGPVSRRERVRGRRHPDGGVRRGAAGADTVRGHRRARHDGRGDPPTGEGRDHFRRRPDCVRRRHRQPVSRPAGRRPRRTGTSSPVRSGSTSRCWTWRRVARRPWTTTRTSPRPSRCETSSRCSRAIRPTTHG